MHLHRANEPPVSPVTVGGAFHRMFRAALSELPREPLKRTETHSGAVWEGERHRTKAFGLKVLLAGAVG